MTNLLNLNVQSLYNIEALPLIHKVKVMRLYNHCLTLIVEFEEFSVCNTLINEVYEKAVKILEEEGLMVVSNKIYGSDDVLNYSFELIPRTKKAMIDYIKSQESKKDWNLEDRSMIELKNIIQRMNENLIMDIED